MQKVNYKEMYEFEYFLDVSFLATGHLERQREASAT